MLGRKRRTCEDNCLKYVDLTKELIEKGKTDFGALCDGFEMLRGVKDAGGVPERDLMHLGWAIRNQSLTFLKQQGSDAADLYKKALLFNAVRSFDDYMIYLEFQRPKEEQFYLPRRKVMKPLVDALQELADDELDELFLSEPPRTGKLLSDDTPVLTTKGWKNHGDLQVGDYVYSPEGKAVPVIGVMPKHHTTHTVTMTDGSKFDCHFRHEWKVYDRRKKCVRIMETQEMIGHLENGKKYGKARGHRYNFQLLKREPISGPDIELPVKPYTLGVWLGDGTNKAPNITHPMKDICVIHSIVNDDGYRVSNVVCHKTTKVFGAYIAGLGEELRKVGMCYSNKKCEKHIPEIYFTASYRQRMELLAGLIDTDGTLVRKEHRYQFSTISDTLKDDFITLVSTFGWRCSATKHDACTSSSGIEGKHDVWTIGFNPTEYIPCRVERKQLYEFSKQRRVAIQSIEPSEHKQGNCITVYGGMYLAGRTLTPTHNTSTLMFYATWIIGKWPEKSNLYCAFSDIITNAFYTGVLEILRDPYTYQWHDIFPDSRIAATNSKDETLDIDRVKRYKTLTCRSLYGTLNGACDCNGILISDDLIGGIEEAMNKDRMVSAWTKVDNNLLPRAKEKAKLLWCGTRWSMIDPAGLRMNLLKSEPKFANRRVKIINLPALNEKDESNFDYLYGVGFSTDFYQQRRASFERNNDMASWLAQYQGEPIERQGALFEPEDMKTYNGILPDEKDLVRIFMAVDPAYGGGDFTASPVCYQYIDGSVYVADVVYCDGDKKVTIPLLVNAVEKYKVQAVQIEANKATLGYTEELDRELRKKNLKVNVTTALAPNNMAKETRIYDKAPEIREFCFLDEGKRSKEYNQFMTNVYSFTLTGKNKHDDAPDSLAMAVDMLQSTARKAELFSRPYR